METIKNNLISFINFNLEELDITYATGSPLLLPSGQRYCGSDKEIIFTIVKKALSDFTIISYRDSQLAQNVIMKLESTDLALPVMRTIRGKTGAFNDPDFYKGLSKDKKEKLLTIISEYKHPQILKEWICDRKREAIDDDVPFLPILESIITILNLDYTGTVADLFISLGSFDACRKILSLMELFFSIGYTSPESRSENFEFIRNRLESDLPKNILKNPSFWIQILGPKLSDFNILSLYKEIKDFPFNEISSAYINDLKFPIILRLCQGPIQGLNPDKIPCFLHINPIIKDFLIEKITQIFPKLFLQEFYNSSFTELTEEDLNNLMIQLSLTYFYNPLEKAPKTITEEMDSIVLKNGTPLFKKNFIKNPLFKKSKEKEDVFNNLWLTIHLDPLSYRIRYDSFLQNLDGEDWFECYWDMDTKQIRDESLICFLAFLNGDIKKESLLVIQTVLEAIRSNAKPIIRTLVADDLPTYLAQTGFPPYSPNTSDYMLTRRKSEEELTLVKQEILESFSYKTPAERTVIEYDFQRLKVARFCQTVEKAAYDIDCRIGFKGSRYAVLLPPQFSIELMAKTSSLRLPDPAKYYSGFGHSNTDGTPYFEGYRDISIPSPWFYLAPPHNYNSKSPGLGMLFHDLNYHIPLDANNPHAKLIIEIAKQFSEKRCDSDKKDQFTRSDWKALSSGFSRHLVDRESNPYRIAASEKRAFWDTLYATKSHCVSDDQEIVKSWRKAVQIPILIEVLIRSGFKNLLDVDDDSPDIQEAKRSFFKL
jgi:hypothetical protein